MGRGQRHSKNAGIMGSEALTYHERKALGFGTVKERVGKVGGPAAAMPLLAATHSRSSPAPLIFDPLQCASIG
jgi:hypothetical protein